MIDKCEYDTICSYIYRFKDFKEELDFFDTIFIFNHNYREDEVRYVSPQLRGIRNRDSYYLSALSDMIGIGFIIVLSMSFFLLMTLIDFVLFVFLIVVGCLFVFLFDRFGRKIYRSKDVRHYENSYKEAKENGLKLDELSKEILIIVDKLERRTCFRCDSYIEFGHFYGVNYESGFLVCLNNWLNEYFEFYCCDCYYIKKDKKERDDLIKSIKEYILYFITFGRKKIIHKLKIDRRERNE